MEDLWPFNEEVLARAVADSELPVISAVGHEIDFTICDFVADMRVPTPSAAAELVVGRQEEFRDFISASRRRMDSSLELLMERCRRRFERAAGSPVFHEPVHLMRQQQQRIDELDLRLNRAVDNSLEKYSATLERFDAGLKNLNPKAVLNRGYSIILDRETGKAVMKKVPPGTKLKGLLAEGEINMVTEDD